MRFLNWGMIPYETAHMNQKILVDEVVLDPSQEAIIFCSHPSVVTLGKKSDISEVSDWKGPVVSVSRGGKATYHGPGQLVIYPILHLGMGQRKRDLYLFLRNLESAVIETLKIYGVSAAGSMGNTGVWVGEKKMASIGVAVKRWVSYHGLAINLHQDPLAFTGISPCGFSSNIMISLEEIIQKKIPHEEFQRHLEPIMNHYFHL